MAQRHEIEAWVNPSAWDHHDEALRVIDAIEASGSDDEAEWVRIAGGNEQDQAQAADRDYDRTEAALAEPLAAFRAAEDALEDARTTLHAAIRRVAASDYRVAQVTGLSARHIGRIRSGQ